VPSAEPSDPVDSGSTSTILLILILGLLAAVLIAWIIRQRSAGTDDAGPPDGPGDDPTAPGLGAAATLAAVESTTADGTPPVVVGDETIVDPSTDPAQVTTDPLAVDPALAMEDPLVVDPPASDPLASEPEPSVGDDDPTSSYRTLPNT
jgi:hypothetical protein